MCVVMTSVRQAAAGVGRRPTLRMRLLVVSLGLGVLLHVGLCLIPVADRQGGSTTAPQRPSAVAMAWPAAGADAMACPAAMAEPERGGARVGVEHRRPRLPITERHAVCGIVATAAAHGASGLGPPGSRSAGPPDPLDLASAGAARPPAPTAVSGPGRAATSLLTRLSVSLM
jgi:hypothetical protein